MTIGDIVLPAVFDLTEAISIAQPQLIVPGRVTDQDNGADTIEVLWERGNIQLISYVGDANTGLDRKSTAPTAIRDRLLHKIVRRNVPSAAAPSAETVGLCIDVFRRTVFLPDLTNDGPVRALVSIRSLSGAFLELIEDNEENFVVVNQ